MESTLDRKKQLQDWLVHTCRLDLTDLRPMVGAASFRRYFRAVAHGQPWVVMDAPPPQENCRPFAAIARALRQLSLNAPEIIAADFDRGFLLLTDMGDMTYLKALNRDNADRLYGRALDALAVLQGCHQVEGHVIPPFTREFMQQEWEWHKEWFRGKWLGLPNLAEKNVLDQAYDQLVESAALQPAVFMHRDYHSANLMFLSGDGIGILDFQDAFVGPVTYDLVSLLRDCYIDWAPEKINEWALSYLHRLQQRGELTQTSEQQFLRWFDWMGLQRHLKALMTFSRKYVRDQQPQYLRHVPRTLRYVVEVSQRYPELQALHEDYARLVQPVLEKVTP